MCRLSNWLLILLPTLIARSPQVRCRIMLDNHFDQLTWHEVADNFQVYVVWAIFPLCLAAFALILFTQIKIPAVRQHPGDLILIISISSFLVSVSYLTSSIYYQSHKGEQLVPDSFNAFCKWTGAINLLGNSSIYIYNALYYINFIRHVKHYVGSRQSVNKVYLHLIVLCFLAAILSIAFATNSMGITVYGICSAQATIITPLLQVGMIFMFFSLCIISLVKVGKLIPQTPELLQIRQEIMRYNLIYLTIYSVIVITQMISKIVTTVLCIKQTFDSLSVFITVGNTVNMLVLILMGIVRLFHPSVWKFIFARTIQQSIEMQPLLANGNRLQQMRKQIYEQRMTSLILGIIAAQKNKLDRELFDRENVVYWYQKLRFVFYKQDLVAILGQSSSPNFMNIQLTQFAPRLFYDWWGDICSGSLLPRFKDIKIQTDQSQLITITPDNKLRIRILKKKEMKQILRYLPKTIKYIEKNSETLLEKPYEVLALRQADSSQKLQYIGVFECLNLPPESILRSYKIKVFLSPKQQIQHRISVEGHQMGLKQFLQNQQKLFLSQQQSRRLIEQLLNDLAYLSKTDVYCYQLIVNLVDKVFVQQMNQDQMKRVKIVKALDELTYYQIYLSNCFKQSRKLSLWEELMLIMSKTFRLNRWQFTQIYSQRFVDQIINVIF